MLAVILTNVPLENISDSQYNKVVGLFITELSNQRPLERRMY